MELSIALTTIITAVISSIHDCDQVEHLEEQGCIDVHVEECVRKFDELRLADVPLVHSIFSQPGLDSLRHRGILAR